MQPIDLFQLATFLAMITLAVQTTSGHKRLRKLAGNAGLMTNEAVILLLALAAGVLILVAGWILNDWLKIKNRRKRRRKRARP